MLHTSAAVNTEGMNKSDPNMSVIELTTEKAVQWDAFVETCPNATFFHLAGWKQVIEHAFGHRAYYLLAETGGEICGVLPLVHIKSRL